MALSDDRAERVAEALPTRRARAVRLLSAEMVTVGRRIVWVVMPGVRVEPKLADAVARRVAVMLGVRTPARLTLRR